MGTEARFQAMPEDCELMIAARQDRDVAESIPFFHQIAADDARLWPDDSPEEIEFYHLTKKVVAEHPGLRDRYFYAGARTYDAIVYLLSPKRRSGDWEDDDTLIYQAIYGEQRLHPEACAGQGYPIGLVSAESVKVIADYLDEITSEILHEHYKPELMGGVYKMLTSHDEYRFEAIWAEFVGMRQLYRAAANHGEAVIAVID